MQDPSGKALPISATVTADEMAALLREGGIVPVLGSPLLEVARREPTAETLQTLVDNGWLDRVRPARLNADLADALHALAAPSGRLRIVIGTAEGLARLDLYRAGGGGGQRWVRWQAEPGGAWGHLECFYLTAAIVERLVRALDLTATFLAPRFSAVWDWDRFQVLLGLVDVYRATSLRAILERGRRVTSTFGVEDVLDALKQGLSRPHYYWAVSLGRLLAPNDININRVQIVRVLDELASEGDIKAAGHEAWRLGRGITELAVSLLLVPSFMSIAVHEGGDPLAASGATHLALVRGANSLWRMEFSADNPPDVEIAPANGAAVLHELRAMLHRVEAPAPRRSPESPPPSASEASAPQSAAPPEPRAAADTSPPAAPVEPSTAPAASSAEAPERAAVPPEPSDSVEGSPTAQPRPAGDEPRICPQCDTRLPADARYCARCGTRVDLPQHVV